MCGPFSTLEPICQCGSCLLSWPACPVVAAGQPGRQARKSFTATSASTARSGWLSAAPHAEANSLHGAQIPSSAKFPLGLVSHGGRVCCGFAGLLSLPHNYWLTECFWKNRCPLPSSASHLGMDSSTCVDPVDSIQSCHHMPCCSRGPFRGHGQCLPAVPCVLQQALTFLINYIWEHFLVFCPPRCPSRLTGHRGGEACQASDRSAQPLSLPSGVLNPSS